VTQLTAIAALAVLAWPAAAQLFLMAASVATVLPEAERVALGRRLAALARHLTANGHTHLKRRPLRGGGSLWRVKEGRH